MGMQQMIKYMEQSDHIYAMLKQCPYEILREWKLTTHAAGTVLFSQGDVQDSFYILVDGIADISVVGENGKKYVQSTYTAGNMLGELEIVDRLPFISNVEAVTDVALMGLKRDHFLKWLQLDRNFNEYFIRSILKLQYDILKKEGDNNLYPLHQRVCSYLLSCVPQGQKNTDGTIIIQIDKQQLSRQFAVTPRSINRILSKLKEHHIINLHKHEIIIRNMDQLRLEEQISRS
ncbi:Crp/Fnr family transcriptional regulator [Paenibacillus sp. ACRRX]|uniref:Crp/Fnr family transcriptional regulator n=1 Tax=unclassified Paenibacillus TaxID=185978 RepID=UPI001EF74D8A|nr:MULTISPECIES: Crp/Fnr family transcriptional regulator [unclassified Paenibacillus]MCG7409633.1 Crp/Fnr family transcriptional regulator [Paenibacillus sp. ACRRX]MDK8183290.1 Crp/Fnr family transcriptional regulator [Paenibacillus sp. UMB4589-SE434]